MKHLRCWHFDVVIFLGLALFASAYWYSMPRPVNQWILKSPGTSFVYKRQLVDVSEDDQAVLTFSEARVAFMESKTTGLRVKRNIEKWSTRTGELLQTIPVQLPEEAVQLDDIQFTVENAGHSPFISAARHVSKKEHHRWFFSAIDGHCLGPAIVTRDELEIMLPLQDSSKESRAWAMIISLDPGRPSYMFDLKTGKTLHSYDSQGTERASLAALTPGVEFLIQFWTLGKGKYDVEVFRIATWESLGRFHISDGVAPQLCPITDTLWAFTDLTRNDLNASMLEYRVRYFRFDPVQKTLIREPGQPVDDYSSPSPLSVDPPFFFKFRPESARRPESKILRIFEDWLGRLGIYRDYSQKVSFQIDDLASGKPLRQVSGLPSGDYLRSPDGRYVFSLQPDDSHVHDPRGREQDVMLCHYAVPHYLWEPTLSWVQWLSWLLVIPWPLRYFAGMRRPVTSSLPPSASGLLQSESAAPPSSSQTGSAQS